MSNHFPIKHLPLEASLPHWFRKLSHWVIASTVRVFLLTLAALLGSLLLNGTVHVVWENRPLLDAASWPDALLPFKNLP